MNNFQKLTVFKEAHKLVLLVYKNSQNFPIFISFNWITRRN